jgi:hypothetical protein
MYLKVLVCEVFEYKNVKYEEEEKTMGLWEVLNE